eukprot:8092051-Pyramimonas_sp.AAC.1
MREAFLLMAGLVEAGAKPESLDANDNPPEGTKRNIGISLTEFLELKSARRLFAAMSKGSPAWTKEMLNMLDEAGMPVWFRAVTTLQRWWEDLQSFANEDANRE